MKAEDVLGWLLLVGAGFLVWSLFARRAAFTPAQIISTLGPAPAPTLAPVDSLIPYVDAYGGGS